MVDQDKAESFVYLLARHERQVAAYVLTLVPQRADADDILQEAKVVMWRHFAEFTPGTNFGAWARKIAFNQILTFRKKRKRDHLHFSEEFLHAVADEIESSLPSLDERQQRLGDCLAKLQTDHQEIVRLRYDEGLGIEEVAGRSGRTVGAVYRLLSRLRAQLHQCVGRTVEAS